MLQLRKLAYLIAGNLVRNPVPDGKTMAATALSALKYWVGEFHRSSVTVRSAGKTNLLVVEDDPIAWVLRFRPEISKPRLQLQYLGPKAWDRFPIKTDIFVWPISENVLQINVSASVGYPLINRGCIFIGESGGVAQIDTGALADRELFDPMWTAIEMAHGSLLQHLPIPVIDTSPRVVIVIL